MKKPLFSFIILFCLTMTVWLGLVYGRAQAEVTKNLSSAIITYSKYEGLLAKDIKNLVQDEQGYIYLATNQGIWKYNGSQFYQFFSKRDGLTSNIVYNLLWNNGTTLWVGTANGLHKVNDNKVLATFSNEGLVDTSAIDEQGNIWYVNNAKQQLVKITDNKIAHIYTAEEGINDPFKILQDRHGQMWVGTVDGLVKFTHGQVERLLTKADGLRNNGIHLLFEDKAGYLWATDIDGGLSKIKDDKVVAVVEPIAGYLEAALADDEGNIWLGSASGLIRYHPDEATEIYTTADGLADNYVMSLLQDRDSNIWIGTANGVSKITRKPIMRPYIGAKIYSQLTDHQGRIWLGTADGLEIFAKERILKSYHATDGLGSDNIKAIIEDKQQRIWVGTTKGLTLLVNDKIINTYTEKDGLPNETIWALAEDKQGRLWVGTDKGLAIMAEDKITHFSGVADPAAKVRIEAILPNEQGHIFVGAQGAGLNLLQEDGTFIRQYTEADGFKGNRVRSITVDNQGKVWVVSTSGYVYEMANEKIINSYTSDGEVILDVPRSIVTGDNDTVWVGLDGFGLSNLVAGKFQKNYSYSDGLINSTIYSLGKDSLGNIMIGTGTGLIKFDPTPFQIEVKIDRVTLPQIDEQGQSYELLASPIITDNYQLSYDQQTVRFRYASLDYRVETKHFQTILEGYDPFWRDVGPETEQTYMNLPPGDYTFKVKVQNFDGSWQPQEATVKLMVLPPFWRTWWFYGLALAAVVGLSWTIFRLRLKAIESQNRYLELQINRRTKELHIAKEETEITLNEMRGLFEAAQSILGADNLEDICQNFIQHFNQIVQADQMVLYLVDHRHKKVLLTVTHTTNRPIHTLTYQELELGLSGVVFQSKQPILSHFADDGIEPEATRLFRKQNGDPHLGVVPLVTKGQVIGTITITNAIDNRSFNTHDINLLMTLATQAAAAIENLQLIKEERRLMEQELDTARQIQLSLLPPDNPNIVGLDIVSYSHPARQVGGDFFSYFLFDPTHLGVVVGDVSGKGLQAAMMMALSVGLFSHEVQKEIPPHILLNVLNTKLHSHTRRNRMNTALSYVDLEWVDQQWLLRIANGGLIAPLMRGAGQVAQWTDVNGLPLGMIPNIEYMELERPFVSGEVMLLSSDGLVEAMNEWGEMYGFMRLTQRLTTAPAGPAQQILDWILSDVQAFVGQAEQHDDITLVIITVK